MGIYCSAYTGDEETGKIQCTLMVHDGSHHNENLDVYFD